jgi:N-methylhydantoinase A
VTDANLLLGRLDPSRFLGGALPLDIEAARRALDHVARPLGLPLEVAALGILAVANAVMERALRRVSVERGYDPRPFTLLPFGGAGPLHACALADALGMRRIVIPTQASVLSALGMLLAPPTRDLSQALLCPIEQLSLERLESVILPMQARARETFAREGVDDVAWQAALDCRYTGQSYELTIPLSLPPTPEALVALAGRFHAAHEHRYGARYAQPVEIVTARLRAVAPPLLGGPWLPAQESTTHQAVPAGAQLVWLDRGGATRIPFFERARLAPGAEFSGPALLYQPDTTLLVAPGWRGIVDRWNNVVLHASHPL